jgi:hypothetical protein
MKKKDVYEKAKATWGIDAQVTKAIEELSELQKELCKFLLDDGNMEHINEEMADVKIMVEQLELILENKEAVKAVKKAKIQRLSDRIDEEETQNKRCESCKNYLCDQYEYPCNNCGGIGSQWELNAE